MAIAALYDIHGNLPALEAVLDEIARERIDRIVVGGDVVPGPVPAECLDRLLALPMPVDYIIGNGDRAVRQARRGEMDPRVPPFFHEAMRWNAAQLSDEHDRTIEGWPLTITLSIDRLGKVLFCHATPRDDNEIFLETTAEEKLAPIFDPLAVDAVVCGHTHMQFDRMVGRTRVINAGSVGMPFQERSAYWLLISETVDLRRTAYDFETAAARVRATSYPLAESFATTSILQPPSRESMLAAFSKAELS